MLDLNQRSVATTDLQSVTFNRSVNDPTWLPYYFIMLLYAKVAIKEYILFLNNKY